MDSFGTLGVVGPILAGTVIATLLLAIWIRVNRSTAVGIRTMMQEAENSISFLFDDEDLLDVTPRARALMEHGDKHRSDWENFLTLVSARFPHMRSQCSDLASVGRKVINPHDGQHGWIEAEHWNGLARITLMQDEDHPEEILDPLTAAAMEHELETLRAIGEDSPQLIWKRDAEGVLVWANRAYIELTEELHPAGPNDVRPWPPRDVFEREVAPVGKAPLIDMHRIDVEGHEKPIWYEVTSLRRGTDTIHFAVDSSAVVFARDAQRTFVQTLTKTFAQLSVGLAIFDEDRRLVLFNPALADLTGLPADFLNARPTLFSLLDRLRDHRMIPEPKNYTTWREQMSELESAAEEGSYYETWSLPNGQTFRVTGKPHPNGAIAFLMEDISDEISLTRKFRSQIDTTTAIIDNLAAAVAVFSASGSLIMANTSYRNLWGGQPEGLLNSSDFSDEVQTWEAASAPSPVWKKLKDTLARGTIEQPWDGSVWIDEDVEILCHYAPLPDGNHQITFVTSERDPTPAAMPKSVELEGGKSQMS